MSKGSSEYLLDERKNYILDGYNQALSHLKGRQFFSQTSASIKYVVMFLKSRE